MSNLWNWNATCFRLFDKKTDAHNNLKGENNKEFPQKQKQPLLLLQLCGGLMVEETAPLRSSWRDWFFFLLLQASGRTAGRCSHIFHPHMRNPACEDFTEKQLIVTLACSPAVSESIYIYIYIYIYMNDTPMHMVLVGGEALTAGVSSTYLRSGHRGSGLSSGFHTLLSPATLPTSWGSRGVPSSVGSGSLRCPSEASWPRPGCVSASVLLFSCDPFFYIISCFISASTSCLTSVPLICLTCVSLLSLSVCLITCFS